MASRSKQDLRPELVEAYNYASAEYSKRYPNDPQPFLTCTYRSPEEQDKLFAQTKPKVTNARGGESPHNYNPSFAFDVAFIKLDKKLDWQKPCFQKFADILTAKYPDVDWGGNWKKFKDLPHFEIKGWHRFK
jgi:peptidoglycan L-alanyl-D-glutamate endopeptidase CwlK